MRITFKKAIGIVHLWLGLFSGLVIFIVAITGAMYVFSDDIIQITDKSFTNVTPQASSSKLIAIAQQERSRFLDDKKVTEWDWQRLYRYRDAGKAAEFECRHYENPDQYVDVFINPYSGKILYTRDVSQGVFWDTVTTLHTSLLLGTVGTYMVDFATLFLLIMLVTGIILWFPKNKKILSQRLRLKWKPTFKWKRKNYDLHNVLGFYASWIAVFMVITGLVWGFSWAQQGMTWILGSPPAAAEPVVVQTAIPGTAGDSLAVIDAIYKQAVAMDTTAYCYHLDYPRAPSKLFNVYARQTRNWSPGNTYYFNPVNGAFLSAKKYADLTAGEKYDLISSDIHYGWIFGWPSKIATFFACLVIASLPITGFLIWWGKRKF